MNIYRKKNSTITTAKVKNDEPEFPDSLDRNVKINAKAAIDSIPYAKKEKLILIRISSQR